MNYINVKNNQRIGIPEIPVLPYDLFAGTIINELLKSEEAHCVNYFGYPDGGLIKLICCIANDTESTISILSSQVKPGDELSSITAHKILFHAFEREIHENFGIRFNGHAWLKPLRYAFNRANQQNIIANYPFYSIESEELHEVGVGPIHAGVIEPGHFRFICNGEQILHLEIQLGYQHRGIEKLFLQKKSLPQLTTLAENIAGDTAVGHTTAFTNAWESLCGFTACEKLLAERAIALEIERIAIHTGDLSAICSDIAYQLGSSVFGRLRTPVINFFQQWCGNRLAKSLIRSGKTNFQFNADLASKWLEIISAYKSEFVEMAEELFDLPSVLSRLEKTGIVTEETIREIGAVGMAARASGIPRDIRHSHPFGYYNNLKYVPVIMKTGDVKARAVLRYSEILKSIDLVAEIIEKMPSLMDVQEELKPLSPDSFVISLVEGWRGEICHCAISGSQGELKHYKIKDPSLHNWLALALAVRNNEISDFPICNKSFNLSYCGHDL